MHCVGCTVQGTTTGTAAPAATTAPASTPATAQTLADAAAAGDTNTIANTVANSLGGKCPPAYPRATSTVQPIEADDLSIQLRIPYRM